jgi:hypothetical protein
LGGSGHEPDDDGPEMSDDNKLQLIEGLFAKWLAKVEAERKARLAGEVVAADFYLRQTTFFEVTFDLMCEGMGEDAWQMTSKPPPRWRAYRPDRRHAD